MSVTTGVVKLGDEVTGDESIHGRNNRQPWDINCYPIIIGRLQTLCPTVEVTKHRPVVQCNGGNVYADV